VTWEDQQNINRFGRLNNRLHELADEIRLAKVSLSVPPPFCFSDYDALVDMHRLNCFQRDKRRDLGHLEEALKGFWGVSSLFWLAIET
jgi:hypothetical protein